MAATYALRFVAGKYKGGEFPLRSNREIVVGRGSEYDMVLDEDMVSRRHAKIVTMNGQILLQDLKSTNGTFVNGEKISVARLASGDKILIGTSIMQLMEMQDAVVAAPRAETPPKPTGVPVPAASSAVRATMMGLPALSATTTNPSAPATIGPLPHAEVYQPPPTKQQRLEAAPTHTDLHEVIASDSPQAEAMAGRFPDDVALAELIELFNANRRTGVLVVHNGDREGRIIFRDGRVCYSQIIAADGSEAVRNPTKMLFRLLTWTEGDFHFESRGAIPPQEGEIEEETRNLILELTRQWDELSKYEGHLPSRQARLSLRLPLEPRLSDLSAETLDSLQSVLNKASVAAVLDSSNASDLETYQDLLYLLQNGYIDVS